MSTVPVCDVEGCGQPVLDERGTFGTHGPEGVLCGKHCDAFIHHPKLSMSYDARSLASVLLEDFRRLQERVETLSRRIGHEDVAKLLEALEGRMERLERNRR